VEEKLLGEPFITAIVSCFTTSKTNAFENILEPLQKLLRLSLPIAHTVGQPQFFARILTKLSHNKAVVRLNLLRILRTICDASEQKETLIRMYGMYQTIQRLAEKDGAVLVRNLASELIKMCAVKERVSYRNRAHRSLSSSTSSTPSLRARVVSSSSQRGNVSDLWSYDVNGIIGDQIEVDLPGSSSSIGSAGRVVQGMAKEKKRVLRRTYSGVGVSNKYVPRRSRGPPTPGGATPGRG
jgi:hypothetical protein